MATKKRKPRSPSRAQSRARSAKSSSLGSFLTLGVIVGIGALSIWATTQSKSPQTALTRLFQPAPTVTAKSTPINSVRVNPVAVSRKTDVSTSPTPRPSIPVGAVGQVAQKTLPPMTTQQPIPVQRQTTTAAISPKKAIQAPRGINIPNMMPAIVFARTRLTIRRNAWDKSAPAGTVDKGREMRSYGKTGKWHRIVVPATDMIGWVHEDMLIVAKARNNISMMPTGSVGPR